MRIAGVDPGTIETGIGIVEDNGKQATLIFSRTIHGGRSKSIACRLETIFTELKSILAEWKPEVMALENVFFQKNFRAAVKVGEARAVAMLAATMNAIPVVEYPPARVKESISGNGRASKGQIQYMVGKILNFSGPLSKDSADAVAVALCHVHSRKFERFRKELARV